VLGGLVLVVLGAGWMLDTFAMATRLRNLHASQLRRAVDPEKPAYAYRAGGLILVALGVAVVVGGL
jgi:hypothetical protein